MNRGYRASGFGEAWIWVFFLSVLLPGTQNPEPQPHLESQGDLVSRLITPINHIVTLVIPIIKPLPKSP